MKILLALAVLLGLALCLSGAEVKQKKNKVESKLDEDEDQIEGKKDEDLEDSSQKDSSAYVGCYKDKKQPYRALPYYMKYGSALLLKGGYFLNRCIRTCKSKGYSYAGLQFSKECWCGFNYNRYGLASSSKCYYKCIDNYSQICGGALTLSVYSTSLYSYYRRRSNSRRRHYYRWRYFTRRRYFRYYYGRK